VLSFVGLPNSLPQKFISGAFQDGGKDVNYFVASISARFGQNFYFSTHKMVGKNKTKHSSDFQIR